jgi:metal-responsive CopG/Arc/MetJ family transcriptional regulator
MATMLKPKSRKRVTSLAISEELLHKVDHLSKLTRRSRSELAEEFLTRGISVYEQEVDTDGLLYDSRKAEKDILLQDCGDILKRIRKLAGR